MRSSWNSGLARWFALGMILAGVVLAAVSWRTLKAHRSEGPAELSHEKNKPTITTSADPLIPTRTAVPRTQGVAPTATEVLTEASGGTVAPSRRLVKKGGYLPVRARFGVGVAMSSIEKLDPEGHLGAGWYLNWKTALRPSRPGSMEFAQMIRLQDGGHDPDLGTISAVARANPGALWLVGNEPDVKWQDNMPPGAYAQAYHQLYTFLKKQDPTCQVAIGGVSQPTPLRLQYLDRVLGSYERRYGARMPVDVWNVHGFILREKSGAWGVDIPPGLPALTGTLYEVQDHDDLRIFARQIVAFRRWMRDRGERDKPLIVSEYGILMPEDYGFPFERVRDFMYATFDYFLTAADEELGYPRDDNRLVQRWAWYSLSDRRYTTGNLIDPDTKEMTRLGLAYRAFVTEVANGPSEGQTG